MTIVFLVLTSVLPVMSMEHARHVLTALTSLLTRRHALLVILDVMSALVLELASVLLALPNTGRVALLVQKSVLLVTLDVTNVLVMEQESVSVANAQQDILPRVPLVQKFAPPVTRVVTVVLVMELARVLHALPTTIKMVQLVVKSAKLVMLENTCQPLKPHLVTVPLALMVHT